jgi:hypothetical protein
MMHTLHADIAAYQRPAGDGPDADAAEESGWKLVHGDVLRPARSAYGMLAVAVGSGVQVLRGHDGNPPWCSRCWAFCHRQPRRADDGHAAAVQPVRRHHGLVSAHRAIRKWFLQSLVRVTYCKEDFPNFERLTSFFEEKVLDQKLKELIELV